MGVVPLSGTADSLLVARLDDDGVRSEALTQVEQLSTNDSRIATVDTIMATTGDSEEAELAAILSPWGEEPFDLLS